MASARAHREAMQRALGHWSNCRLGAAFNGWQAWMAWRSGMRARLAQLIGVWGKRTMHQAGGRLWGARATGGWGFRGVPLDCRALPHSRGLRHTWP
jgi:hypothetical protein